MSRLLIASNNRGKRIEIQALFEGLEIELIMPHDIGLDLSVVEDGHTYEENAAKKAHAFADASGLLTLADDSGLEVDALNGAPGLFSARYSNKPGASDADRRHYLLKQLRDKPKPWIARFRCVIAIATVDGSIVFSEGICPGEIISEERGSNGFGYDPIFLLPELGLTMAELEMSVKNQYSHRARAVRAAIPKLTGLIEGLN